MCVQSQEPARVVMNTGSLTPLSPHCLSANPLMLLPPVSCVIVDILKSHRALPRQGAGGGGCLAYSH